ncbi:N-acetylmuramoyl-L-alanine amidase [Roseomonas frigidaquae]|uniref:N-acetylmuramoyl-L-alanine amidase n=1 Tax=Falsiroseomonas frigidaquae TaxID=487318 RepID=A0ABX1ERJ5_9PROT|nr:N-acetylmuramoyl-L-alanine amidase [Falsiroseomonas frigidaquae]NKE43240.1 N-acetylmuramoyl-L-alanine amidase [Falsiroseomonas frigidaquae]
MLGRRALASLMLGLAALPAPTEVLAAVTGASLEAIGPGARLTITLPAGARWKLLAARRPNRLLLEVPGQAWRAATRLRGAGPVRAARIERGRLRLDLSGPVALRRAASSGNQLVIEVVPGAAAPFARLAGGGSVMAEGGGPASAARRTADLPLVVLDPGHGGRDPGAIGTRGTQEKRVVLAAAIQLKRVLEAGGRCRVALTRSNDRFVALGARVDFARRRQAALFVSLHADSAPGARGASVYTLGDSSDSLAGALARRENQADRAGGLRLPSVPPEVQAILASLIQAETRIGSARMAQQVVAELGEDVPLLPNTHRQAGFVVLKAPDVPAVLVEMGFLSDPQDEAALRRADHRAKLARAMGRAIHGWLAQSRDMAAVFG